MLIYEKLAEGIRHIFGTFGNVPDEADSQLSYKNQEGATATPTLNDTYLDDGHGGIIQKSTGDTINVFLDGENIIPGASFEKKLVGISAIPSKTEYSVNDKLGSITVYPYFNTGIGDTPLETTDYTVDPAVGTTLDTAGTITVTVTGADSTDYEGMTDEFEVTVE